VRFASATEERRRHATSHLLAASFVIGIATAVITASCALAFKGEIRAGLSALAWMLPLLFLQDTWRYAYFGRGRPAGAALLDLIWLVTQLAFFGVLIATSRETLTTLVVAWGLGSALATLAASSIERTGLALRSARVWLNEHRDLGIPLAGDFLMQYGSSQLVVFGLPATTGVT